MLLYIKQFADFKTVAALDVLSSSLCIDSCEAENGTVTVVGNNISRSLAGGWAVIDGNIYALDCVTPQDGRTLLTLKAPEDAFSRLIPYTAPASGSGGAFAMSELLANYTNQSDEMYAMPYLTVSNSDTTAFVEPEADSNGLYALSDYLRLLRRMRGVKSVFTFTTDTLTLNLTPTAKTARVVPFNDGHSQLETVSYSDSGLAKVTTRHKVAQIASTDASTGKVTYVKDEDGNTVYDIVTADWYLTEDGEVVSSPPARRVSGSWETLTVAAKDDPQTKAEEQFSKSSSSHKIEFWSDRAFNVYDPCTFNVYGEIMSSYISYIGTRSTDSRYYYRSGELQVTASDKLKGLMNK